MLEGERLESLGGRMMRIRTAAICLALAGCLFWPVTGTRAQSTPAATRVAQAAPDAAPAAPRRSGRPLKRLRIYPRYQAEPDGVYPRYNPGPNAVRDCTANYVEEHRPSGTVIVPRMHCFWRPG
jgi:hypothetical protein